MKYDAVHWCIGAVPLLGGLGAQAWADIHRSLPFAWLIETVPTRAGAWADLSSVYAGGYRFIERRATPTPAHYAEVAALNPGMRAVAWGGEI